MFQQLSTLLAENKIDISYLISKFLGYSIVIFSITLKLPQIINMMKIKSDRGLSYLTIYTEILMYLLSALYAFHKGNPFSTYGENVFILIQNLAILFLCYKYAENSTKNSKLFGVLFLIFSTLVTIKSIEGSGIPEYIWTFMASASIPLSSIGRMSQIFVSFREKDTGSLSSITYFLGMMGSLTRIFTTYTETKDLILIANFVYAAFLNFVILVQILIYGDKSKKIALKEKNN
jgi:mannose-P-dolichol utilization defect protein 1